MLPSCKGHNSRVIFIWILWDMKTIQTTFIHVNGADIHKRTIWQRHSHRIFPLPQHHHSQKPTTIHHLVAAVWTSKHLEGYSAPRVKIRFAPEEAFGSRSFIRSSPSQRSTLAQTAKAGLGLVISILVLIG